MENLNLMMAAGNAPDLSFTYDAVLTAHFAQQGGLADLTAVLDKYGPNLKKFLGKDWLDKLGMAVPTTRDQWLAAVKAFRDKVVPIGGVAGDVNIPYSFHKPGTERDRAAWIGPSSTRPA